MAVASLAGDGFFGTSLKFLNPDTKKQGRTRLIQKRTINNVGRDNKGECRAIAVLIESRHLTKEKNELVELIETAIKGLTINYNDLFGLVYLLDPIFFCNLIFYIVYLLVHAFFRSLKDRWWQ